MRPLTLVLLLTLPVVALAQPQAPPPLVTDGTLKPPTVPAIQDIAWYGAWMSDCPNPKMPGYGGCWVWTYSILPLPEISGCERADMIVDNKIDFLDWIFFQQHWGKTCSEVNDD